MSSSDRPNPLETDHLIGDLRLRTVRGVSATAAAQAVKLVANLAAITVLARILLPEDFGLVAIVTAFVMIFSPIVSSGFQITVVQRPDLTENQVNWLFLLALGLGLSLAATLALAASNLAELYGNDALRPLFMIFSLSFLITAVRTVPYAILQRQMRFGLIALIDASALVVGVFLAITVAIAGGGPWAIVMLSLVPPSVTLVAAFFFCGWLPSYPRLPSHLGPLVRFGASVTGSAFIGTLQDSLVPLALGRSSGAEAVGHFNRSNAIVSLPNTQLLPPIIQVAQPALARVAMDPERLHRATVELMRKVTYIAFFFTIIIAALAEDVVFVFLGPGWEEVVPYVRWMSLWLLTLPAAGVLVTSLQAAGAPQIVLRSKIVNLPITFFALLVGGQWGALGMVSAFALAEPLAKMPCFILLARAKIRLSMYDLVSIFGPGLVMASICATVITVIQTWFGDWHSVVALFCWTAFGLVIYVVAGLPFKDFRRELRAMPEAAKRMLLRKK